MKAAVKKELLDQCDNVETELSLLYLNLQGVTGILSAHGVDDSVCVALFTQFSRVESSLKKVLKS